MKTLSDTAVSLMYKYGVLFQFVTIEQKHFDEWLFDLLFYFNIDEEGLLRKRSDLSRYRFERVREEIAIAKYLLHSGRLHKSENSSYYAMFRS